jgi:Cft2 family RNA processing exonuclease
VHMNRRRPQSGTIESQAGFAAELVPGLLNDSRQKIGAVSLDPGTPGLVLLTSTRRAKESLAAFQGLPITAAQALAEIESNWPRAAKALDHVRPYQFLKVKGQPAEGELRILLSWTHNDARSRGLLFELGPEMGSKLGWYPLVKGRWRAAGINASVQLAGLATRSPAQLDFPLGQLLYLRDLTSGRGFELGVAIELRASKLDILFDLGMGGVNPSLQTALQRAKLIVLSHAHRDHAGGLPEALASSSAQILMTEATLLQLLAIHMRLNRSLIRKLLDRVLVCSTVSRIGFADGATLQTWPANHGPGSIATVISTSTGQNFLYSGDISLANSYGDSFLRAIEGSSSPAMPRRLDLAVIDGTFLGRQIGTQSAAVVLNEFILGCIDKQRTALVVADAPDVAFLLFIELYQLVMSSARKKRQVQAYVGPHTSALMTLVASAYIDGRLDDMDPELMRLWHTRQNIFETHQVWDIDGRVLENVRFQNGRREHIVFILTTAELNIATQPFRDALDLLSKQGIDTLLVGRARERPFANRLRERNVLKLRSSAVHLRGSVQAMNEEIWALHSASSDLMRWMRGDLGQQLDQIRVFHNSPVLIRESIRGLSRLGVLPIAKEEALTPSVGARR